MDEVYEGTKLAFGRPLETQLDLTKAKVVVTLDADILGAWPQWLAQQRQWAERRAPGTNMNRLYVAEAPLTCTGMMADHRLRTRSSDLARIARALHWRHRGRRRPMPATPRPTRGSRRRPRICRARAARRSSSSDRASRRRCTRWRRRSTRAKSAAVSYTAPVTPSYEPLATLAGEIKAGRIDTLVMTAWNPSYSAPGDLGFDKLLAQGAERALPRHARGRDLPERRLVRAARAMSSSRGAMPAPPTARSRCSSR